MCGIIGAVSEKDITKLLFEGLIKLEYRGYDSSGLAIIDRYGKMRRIRRLGKVKNLIQAAKHNLIGNIGIGHTRWATHGSPSEKNAHPHISEYITVVHNGIIENYEYIKNILIKRGYNFNSDTDTEVIAHLFHWEQKKSNNDKDAMLSLYKQLNGSYSFVIMDSRYPKKLIAIRYGSPLIIGCGKSENFIASDQLALSPYVKKFIYLKEGDIAEITYNNIIINNNGNIKKRKKIKSNFQYNYIKKGLYKHYMQKEIYDQPQAIKNTIDKYIKLNKIELFKNNKNAKKILKKINNVKIVACGTSYNAGMVARYWFESLANIYCDVEIASEFRYRKPIVLKKTLFIALSQSGETADTLAALRLSKILGYMISLSICNVESSSLIRESDLSLLTHAGTEISVASTKSFTTQLTMLLILIANIIILKDSCKKSIFEILDCLKILPTRIEQVLSQDEKIKSLATNFVNKKNVIFIGRGSQYPIAIEGALKLKEISYIYAESYAAGELKHGPLALIDLDVPVVILAPKNKLLSKIKFNIEEVHARGGVIYLFTEKNSGFKNKKRIHVINLPYVEDIIAPIFYVIPLQLLSYYVSVKKGTDIDQPRNLAKSVTVE